YLIRVINCCQLWSVLLPYRLTRPGKADIRQRNRRSVRPLRGEGRRVLGLRLLAELLRRSTWLMGQVLPPVRARPPPRFPHATPPPGLSGASACRAHK